MIKRAALIGLGTMGPGIAARLSRGGLDVAAYDVSDVAVERASGMLDIAGAILDRLDIKAPASGAGTVRFVRTLAEAVDGAELVIENVPENIDIKAETYRAIDPLIGSSAIVASDTSGIPITKLQAHISHPERLVGMHWSNPPHIIPMIEVIGGEKTAPETVATIRDLIRSIGLLPVVVKKDVPGFVENRVLYALLREAVDLVERGVIEPEDLDTCVSWGIGYKVAVIGPMALLDMAGLDIYKSVSSFLNADLSNRDDVAPMVLEKTGASKFGIKSGEGMFSYTPEQIKALQGERARKLVAVRRILEGQE
ncbi:MULTISPECIES: 5-formyl-3-hydroxy-2-methylpyridine 4-carboxylate 5-dehydrogenase [unclassified Mesorhizobium]|uniref:5-formyl-3-hydroxy-2-methylpyridine 4-carboxylate 5-dehydrogenase n=1 Tax=unclassified Mesorhizobium TaxID=325217 RepID=UPI000FD4157E|nr:5-formyl-3-hydroxy-2-methylpyridine 4-carboxylate 5-dehydrogenase [Mesorhizobium sp.]RUV30685.1 3-hydroxyacyl-CoA dehydrogenase family protein [Mesorhizobium sp. M5C.F.Ca.IN.020.32.2.1]RWC42944.1 MAG: 3-hydroxyacyl-CoA dehydrogenase family protein [Mesorhizobium sp.]RWF03245.1 MAG: 3-hydroxyacyl-CoA dehydrogenase family protein [Mesorhizobium sp.]RWG45850.1 MAG: 3-hydroxyacyl-CoA dehydrogenase family protein [Mesorhizobium sp.]RWH48286.1 MAG: 3-hydroxyacyl-CoA dehydrogenase family protein [